MDNNNIIPLIFYSKMQTGGIRKSSKKKSSKKKSSKKESSKIAYNNLIYESCKIPNKWNLTSAGEIYNKKTGVETTISNYIINKTKSVKAVSLYINANRLKEAEKGFIICDFDGTICKKGKDLENNSIIWENNSENNFLYSKANKEIKSFLKKGGIFIINTNNNALIDIPRFISGFDQSDCELLGNCYFISNREILYEFIIEKSDNLLNTLININYISDWMTYLSDDIKQDITIKPLVFDDEKKGNKSINNNQLSVYVGYGIRHKHTIEGDILISRFGQDIGVRNIIKYYIIFIKKNNRIPYNINELYVFLLPISKNIIIIGGGGGASALLKILKPLVYNNLVNSLIGIISNSDDGGSTGLLRREYDTSAWGDMGKNILALIDDNNREKKILADSLAFRFNTGFLKGHTIRNILMTGLDKNTDVCNNNKHCPVDTLISVLGIPETLNIIPATDEPSKIIMEISKDGIGNYKVNGQAKISFFPTQIQNNDIKIVVNNNSNKPAKISGKTKLALQMADIIIVSPGDLYGSIIATLAVPGLKKEITSDKKLIYILPFFNRQDVFQTHGWTSSKYVELYNRYLREPDLVIVNNKIKRNYKNHHWIPDDIKKNGSKSKVISTDLTSNEIIDKVEGDIIIRSPSGFDSIKMFSLLKKVI